MFVKSLQINKIENHINGKSSQKYMKDQVYGSEKGNGEKDVGHLELETPRFGARKWEIKLEEKR